MLFHPAILALLVGSVLISLMLIFSAYNGVTILRRWDLKSGSELQLGLERKTYLISTLVSYAFTFQLFSLFLFIYAADHLSPLFSGAMCAAGTLNVNPWGYPTFLLKMANFVLGGLWLAINGTDNRAYDYPLIRKKYGLLLLMTPFVIAETISQGNYFVGLKPDIITSCCGALFSSERQGMTSAILALPRFPVETAFYSGIVLTGGFGIFFYRTGRAGYLFSFINLSTLLVSGLAFLSYICLYFYELPTHHCPFCILQKEYGYVGYPIYLTFLGAAVSGIGVGSLMPFRKIESLKEIIPSIQKRLVFLSLLCIALYSGIMGYQVIFSNLKMGN